MESRLDNVVGTEIAVVRKMGGVLLLQLRASETSKWSLDRCGVVVSGEAT